MFKKLIEMLDKWLLTKNEYEYYHDDYGRIRGGFNPFNHSFLKRWQATGDDGTPDNHYLKTKTFENGKPWHTD